MRDIENRNLVERRDAFDKLCSKLPNVESEKLLEVYMSLINSRNPSTQAILIPVRQFCAKIGWKSVPGRSVLDKFVEALGNVKINGEDMEKGIEYENVNVFEFARLRWVNGIRCFEIKPTESALPLFFDYKNHYVTYLIGNVFLLSSMSAMRLHRLLQRESFRQGSFEISLDELKLFLGLEGKYSGDNGWSELNRKVIGPCVKELNQLTDLDVTYEKGKLAKGGKVVTLLFQIKKNEDKARKIASESLIVDCSSDKKGRSSLSSPANSETFTIKPMSDFESRMDYYDYVSSLPENIQRQIMAEDQRKFDIETLKDVVGSSFTDNEMGVIYDVLCNIFKGNDLEEYENRKSFLQAAYFKMLAYEAQGKDLNNPIKNRFAYLLSILQSN